jgi:hypothetical protein
MFRFRALWYGLSSSMRTVLNFGLKLQLGCPEWKFPIKIASTGSCLSTKLHSKVHDITLRRTEILTPTAAHTSNFTCIFQNEHI